jgi:hypothetical protein
VRLPVLLLAAVAAAAVASIASQDKTAAPFGQAAEELLVSVLPRMLACVFGTILATSHCK